MGFKVKALVDKMHIIDNNVKIINEEIAVQTKREMSHSLENINNVDSRKNTYRSDPLDSRLISVQTNISQILNAEAEEPKSCKKLILTRKKDDKGNN